MAAPEPRVRILGGRVVQRAQDGNALPGLVAVLDVRVPPFVLFGCMLYRRRDRAMTLTMPDMKRVDGNSSGIRLEDDELRAEMTRAACDLARMLGANIDAVETAPTGFAELADTLRSRSEAEG